MKKLENIGMILTTIAGMLIALTIWYNYFRWDGYNEFFSFLPMLYILTFIVLASSIRKESSTIETLIYALTTNVFYIFISWVKDKRSIASTWVGSTMAVNLFIAILLLFHRFGLYFEEIWANLIMMGILVATPVAYMIWRLPNEAQVERNTDQQQQENNNRQESDRPSPRSGY